MKCEQLVESSGNRRRAKQRPTAFVIMPFSATDSCPSEAEWTEIFEHVFTPALRAAGYQAVRSQPSAGSLTRAIIDSLHSSAVVIADVTDRNANVFYELGVRHALARRGTIIVSQHERHIPSDLRGYWFTVYGRTPGAVVKLRTELLRILAEIETDPSKTDNPVAEYLDQENRSGSLAIDRENAKRVGALYTELTGNMSVLEASSLTAYQRASSIEYECLNLLLTTFYVDLGPEVLRKAFEYRKCLRMIQASSAAPKLIKNALHLSKELAKICFDVRNRMLLGKYKEPEELSTMIWTAPVGDYVVPSFADGGMLACPPGDIDRRLLLLSCEPAKELASLKDEVASGATIIEPGAIDAHSSTQLERARGLRPSARASARTGKRRRPRG